MKITHLFLCIALLTGCSKDEGMKDKQLPVITITSPTSNQAFTAAQTITVSGNITDNIRIKEVQLEIFNTTTGILYTHEHFAPDAASYMLLRTFTGLEKANYKISVEAGDTSDNTDKTEINISVN